MPEERADEPPLPIPSVDRRAADELAERGHHHNPQFAPVRKARLGPFVQPADEPALHALSAHLHARVAVRCYEVFGALRNLRRGPGIAMEDRRILEPQSALTHYVGLVHEPLDPAIVVALHYHGRNFECPEKFGHLPALLGRDSLHAVLHVTIDYEALCACFLEKRADAGDELVREEDVGIRKQRLLVADVKLCYYERSAYQKRGLTMSE